MKDEIQKFLDFLPENYNTLDAHVNIEVQLEYFKLSKKLKKDIDFKDILNKKALLLTTELTLKEKKELLIQIASIDKPEAFRIIENYLENPEKRLKDWAQLALLNSKMLLQSKYLDEPQVFISTGLGGKDKLLRYFVVFFSKNNKTLTKTQHKVVRNEIEAFFKNKTHFIEGIKFLEKYITITILLPIKTDLSTNFKQIIRECNIYGNFLETKCILTNIKILTEEEITQIKDSNNKLENE